MADDLKRRFEVFCAKAIDLLHRNIKTAFLKLGEECIARVRDRSQKESWIDRTGNLRSSIGYAIYDHAVTEVMSAFASVGGPQGTGAEGSATGKKLLEDLASKYADVYALVVIAGMDYASYVEAIESKDVLESTKIWANGIVEQRMKNAVSAAVREINKWEI